MSESSGKSPIYIKSIQLKDIRCFGDEQILELADTNDSPAQWTLILGDNGVGKTTLLECLAWMRPVPYPENGQDDDQRKSRVKPQLDEEEDSTLESLLRQGSEVKAHISSCLVVGSKLGIVKDNPNGSTFEYKISISGKDGSLTDLECSHAEIDQFHDLQMFGYGAGRRMESKNIGNKKLRDPVLNLFSIGNVLYDAEEFLLQLDYQRLQKSDEKAEKLLNAVKNLLADLLPEVTNADSIIICGPVPLNSPPIPGKVLIQMPTGEIPLGSLSLGYKTMLAWATDLALRLFQNNPDSEFPLKEPCIVLVDEFDLHLHPKWQRGIKSFLTEHFPGAQFICTAHSPLMAQASEDSNIAVLQLNNGMVMIENNPQKVKGWSIDQILTSDLFKLPGIRSRDIESQIKKRQYILDKSERTPQDEESLVELDNFLSSLPTDHQDTQRAIDLIKSIAAELEAQEDENDPDN